MVSDPEDVHCAMSRSVSGVDRIEPPGGSLVQERNAWRQTLHRFSNDVYQKMLSIYFNVNKFSHFII